MFYDAIHRLNAKLAMKLAYWILILIGQVIRKQKCLHGSPRRDLLLLESIMNIVVTKIPP